MNVNELFDRITENLSVRRSFGKPYESAGTMVIPVAFVAGGGGGGEGTTGQADPDDVLTDGLEEDSSDASASGSGGGFGGVVIPVGAYVVKDDQVRWVPAVNVTLLALAGMDTIRVLARIASRSRHR